ncbi:hypothetical protein [Ruminococcus flavefaciens]|uniref:DUF3592 domain-containing protein n=1 Tax=Ruminococcus flavefaciens TaxID=1265 RepID=A0A1M7JK51_RUMFL|nr:hypothetical protein [Ruminococcus flavefaciens]SHM53489.1 hypothetical protein SAMN04487860_10663 [Ruminococcus flavefaciens]
MEVILVIIVISVLAVILGVKVMWLVFGFAALIGLAFAVSMLLLTIFFVRLLFTKKHRASFSRIDKSPRSKFKVAYYIIDGTEYPNIFPEEGFLRNMLYRSDKSHTVFLTRNKKYVYDKFACTTCTIGFLLSIVSVIAGFFIFDHI